MKLITKNAFQEYAIGRCETIDFVAKCVTPWHLVGLRAFVEQLCSTRPQVNGILLIRKHSSGKIISESELKFPSNARVDVFEEDLYVSSLYIKFQKFFKSLFGIINIEKKGHIVYIIQSFYQDYEFAVEFLQRTNCQCELVCLDEGFGSYRSRSDLRHYYFSKGWKMGIMTMLHWNYDALISKRINIKKSWFTILKRRKEEWVKNEEVCKWYHMVLIECDEKAILPIDVSKYVLMLTQPIDVKEQQDSAEVVNAALDHEADLYKRLGYKVYIKPHPRESQEAIANYLNRGYEIFPYKGGIESLMGRLSVLPECIIGINTTALVTSKTLFGIRSISVVKKIEGSVAKGFDKTNRCFYNYFKNIVEF